MSPRFWSLSRTEIEELMNKYERFRLVLEDAADFIEAGDDPFLEMSDYQTKNAVKTLYRTALVFNLAESSALKALDQADTYDPRDERGYFGELDSEGFAG